MLRVEQGQVIVTLVGAGGHYPGTSEAAFLDFARRVPDPLILHTLQHATPCGPIYGYRGTENRRRHFERMDRWPNRLIVLGDAACALNPIYAQGLTVGALAVSELSRWLGVQVARLQDGGEPAHSRQLQAQLARLVRLPWTLATAEDLRWPTTTGGSPSRFSPLTARYMQRLFQVMAQHAGVARSFLEVMHMVRGPSALLSPRVVLRMLASR